MSLFFVCLRLPVDRRDLDVSFSVLLPCCLHFVYRLPRPGYVIFYFLFFCAFVSFLFTAFNNRHRRRLEVVETWVVLFAFEHLENEFPTFRR